MGFFSEFFGLLKFAMMGGFFLCIVFMVLIALPRSPFRDFSMQLMLWSIVCGCGFLVASPIDFIPLLPFDDLVAGGTGLTAAATAIAQKARHAREDKEQAELKRRTIHPAGMEQSKAA